jgi:polyhydroxyalkanoate synthesis regulator phasin
MGEDSTPYRNLLSQRDELTNLASSIVTRRSEAAGAGIGRTDAGRALLAAEKPGLGLTPSANNMIVDRMLQDLLAEAQATSTHIDPVIAQQIQELAGQNYQSVPTVPQAGSVIPPGATPQMPQMPDVQAEIDALDEQIRALEAQLRGR